MVICKEEAYEIAIKSDSSGMPTGTLSSAMKTSGNGNGWAWSAAPTPPASAREPSLFLFV